ncbi:alcohol dehydrogenase catalytic domain-containing protein [Rudanella paleaurantiibacter]|uniref:Alcohol dehydrogenase catalytic domain-containing protein n=1 Tax=Rudanella paleaurantiibacter TaxID=2614655 RepID=A0A7J5TZD9_9BACT|nr:alcohol dehydrogenase catalytic domain-containing protein [Rudanella paleaurantiibacter]KAB7730435.1 alcohol dehydrogenase catalytic domain-containing protein [Rudanella paleaurantiibacter]
MLAKAAIATGDGHFRIDTIEVNPPQTDEILVEVKAAGICHTDYDSLSWQKPLVMGHEGAGIVRAVGPAVTRFRPGDAVILNWAIPCGRCFQCLEGNQHICEVNSPVTSGNRASGGHAALERTTYRGQPIERAFSLGTLSTHTVVREAAAVRLTAEMPFPSAAIVGCGVMTGYGSVVNAAKVKPGRSVVVLGSGGVGLNVIQGARIAGASMIIAVDINANRLDMARQYGATHTIQADRADTGLLQAAQQVKTLTGGRGADYAFECTAIPELGAAPLAMVRNAGMAVQVSGIEQTIAIDMNLFEWDKVYINPLYGQCRPDIDFPILQRLYETGALLLDELITRTYTLDELQTAFDDMLAGRNAKGVVVF